MTLFLVILLLALKKIYFKKEIERIREETYFLKMYLNKK